jgi:transposase
VPGEPILEGVTTAISGRPSYQELLEIVRRLQHRVEELEAENRKLHGLLEEARRAGRRQAGPFSKGEPMPHPRPPGRKSGKDHGPSAFRDRPSHVNEEHDAPLPDECPDCGTELWEERVEHQYQTEIPRVKPLVRRFDVHVGFCPCCGRRFQGRHPLQTSDALGAAGSQLGPNAVALAAHLNKVVGAPYRKVVAFFQAAFGFVVSPGGLARALQRVAAKFEPTYGALLSEVRSAPVAYPDETSARMSGVLWWLWVFVTPNTTVYVLRPSRGFDVIDEVLGKDFGGALGHDGWAPYDQLVGADHQQCVAHLLRRAKELLETAVRGAVRFPRVVKALFQDALTLRDRRDAGDVSEHGFAVARGHLNRRMDDLLEMRVTHEGNRRFQKHLRNHADQLFTFLLRPDIEATSWMADHATRPAVLFRKISGGHRSPRGAHTHEVLLSVYRTCWQRLGDAISLTAQALCARTKQVFQIARALPAP